MQAPITSASSGRVRTMLQVPVFLNNEPFLIREAGVGIEVIDPHDFGVPTLGLTCLTRQGMVIGNRDVIESFLRPMIRATYWAREHIDEAIEITLEWAEGSDSGHQWFLLEMDLQNAEQPQGIGLSDATRSLSVSFGSVPALLSNGRTALGSPSGALDVTFVTRACDVCPYTDSLAT